MAIIFNFTNSNPDEDVPKSYGIFKNMKAVFNYKLYTTKHTGLTYRQISYINKNILNDDRGKEQGWRTFSFKEIVYLSIVQELRKFGLKDKQLLNLKRSFFDERNKKLSDTALYLTWREIKVSLFIDSEFNVRYFKVDSKEPLPEHTSKAFIELNLNEYVNDVWEKVGHQREEYKGVDELFKNNLVKAKDKKVIDLLQQEGYKDFVGRPFLENGKELIIITGSKRRVATIKEINKLMDEEFTRVTKEKKVGKNKYKILIEKSHKI